MKSTKIIAIANQKGGGGKTTTTLSIGVALAKEGKKVLLVDADPQGNLTTSLGYYQQEDMPITLADLMYAEIMDKEIKIHEAILHHEEKIDLIPSDISLSAIELSLGNAMSREFILRNCLNKIKDEYDYILIDCMPSLGLIPINCLACSNEIIIPVQSQYLAMRGMTYLFETVSKVKRTINPDLRIKGILLTLVDRRANLSKNVRQELENNYGKYVKIYETEIPLAIKTAEASIKGKSIFEYDKKILRNMMGAEIKFIIVEVDRISEKTVGSRLKALKRLQEINIKKVEVGDIIYAKIIGVWKKYIRIECLGMDFIIKAQELQYGYIDDVSKTYKVNEQIKVIIKEISAEDKTMKISVKDLLEDPFKNIRKDFTEKGEYLATITGYTDNGIFANIAQGVDTVCTLPTWLDRPPFPGEKVIIKIYKIVPEKRKIYSSLVKIMGSDANE